MTNIEEMAVQTFSVVPEAYQQVFVENGADFPDELVSAIKQDPEQAAKLLENDKQLKSAVVQVFKSNKESILQAAQQAQNPSSMKNGGKILGIMKFQLGGKYSVKNGDYSASVQAPGDTLRTKVYPYTTREMQTYPNGNVRYTIFRKSDTQNFWSPQSKPNFLQKLWYGTKTVPAEEAQNWKAIIANHPEDPRNILKKQNGGEVNMLQNTALISNIGPFGKAIGEATGNLNQITGAAYQPNPSQNMMKPVSSKPNGYLFGNNAAKKYNQEMEKRRAVLNKLTTPKVSQPTNNYLNSDPAIG